LLGCGLIMVYILMRFGQWPFSLAAVISILHNVLVTLAVTAAFKLEVNASFIAVVLTIIGYSINDTIIIFDRVRENIRGLGTQYPMVPIANLSLTQTLTRSFNTVLMVMIMTTTLMVFGGANLRDFMIAMLAGLLATAYSSICIATPMMLWLGGGKSAEVTDASSASVASPNVNIPRPATSGAGSAGAAGKGKARKQARRR
jgi:SecD/SecF fusion protein